MFNCYLHGWSSLNMSCPLCVEIKTSTTASSLFPLENEIDFLKEEIKKLKAQLWVAKDSQLRTYDGMSQRSDMAEKMYEALKWIADKKSDSPGAYIYRVGIECDKIIKEYERVCKRSE